jgi:hypothetical protein
MTKHTQDAPTAPTDKVFAGFDPAAMLRAFQTKMNSDLVSGNNPVAGWLEMNQHWMAFMAKRLEQDAALLQGLSKCTKPAEIGTTYSDFFKSAVVDYQKEFTEIGALGQNLMDQHAVPDETDVSRTD